MISTHSASDEYPEEVMVRGRIVVHRENFTNEAVVGVDSWKRIFNRIFNRMVMVYSKSRLIRLHICLCFS